MKRLKHSVIFMLCGLGSVLLLSTCGGSINIKEFPESPHAADHPLPKVALQFSLIQTGAGQTLEAFTHSDGSYFESREVAHIAILIIHPQGKLLFDTGLGEKVDAQFEEIPWLLRPLMAYEKHGSARSQLERAEIDLQGLRIILSHMHWDHASGIEDFPEQEIWTTKLEHDWALKKAEEESGLLSSQFDAEEIKWRYLSFEDRSYENFSQSLDLFKDGSVILVPLPGHTPGAIGMFINLPSGERYLFTGDTSWSLEGIQKPSEKFWISRLLADDNSEGTTRELVRLHRLMLRRPELQLIPSHDARTQAKLPRFPQLGPQLRTTL